MQLTPYQLSHLHADSLIRDYMFAFQRIINELRIAVHICSIRYLNFWFLIVSINRYHKSSYLPFINIPVFKSSIS